MPKAAKLSPALERIAEELQAEHPELFPPQSVALSEPRAFDASGAEYSGLLTLLMLRERPPFDDEYIDTATLAAVFKLSESFFAKLRVSGGGPPFIKMGSQARYRFADVKRWAAEHFSRRSTSEIDPVRAA